MNEPTVESGPVSQLNLSRLLTALFRPRVVFESIASASKPVWRTPMFVWSITTILVVVLGGWMQSHAALTVEVTLPPDWQYWSPDMQESFMQAQQTAQSPMLVYVLPIVGALIGLWFGWFVLAGMLHLGSTLFGGRGAMAGALNIAAWAAAPLIVRDVLRMVFILAAKHPIQSAGLSGFVDGDGMVAQLLALVDIFLIWNIVLLVVGLRVVDSLSKSKAVIAVILVVAILLLAQAGFAALGAGLGSAMQGAV